MEHEARWGRVDDYLSGLLLPADATLDSVRASAAVAGMPDIHVAPTQGMMLHLLARAVRAERILEIGTLAGYSTICLARALPDHGRLVTLEIDPMRALVAETNLASAGVAGKSEIRVGPAAASLAALHAEGSAPFDLVFIDADKPNNPVYFEWSLRLTRPGSVIIIDNVVRDGEVIDASSTDESVIGVRRVLEMIAREPRVRASALQTVGAKGHDGFLLALVTG